MQTVPALRRSVLAMSVCAAAALPMSTPAWASDLDGRSFSGVFIERGKTSGDADTIVFKDGRFRSVACDRYGYGDAPYKMSTVGDTVLFETETESPKYGRLVWRGAVRNGKLDAVATSVRSGKSPVENWVVAAEKK